MKFNVFFISVAIGLLANASHAVPIVGNVEKMVQDVTQSPSGVAAPLAGTDEFAQKTIGDATDLTSRQVVGGDLVGQVVGGVPLAKEVLGKRQVGGDLASGLVGGVPVAGDLLGKYSSKSSGLRKRMPLLDNEGDGSEGSSGGGVFGTGKAGGSAGIVNGLFKNNNKRQDDIDPGMPKAE